MSNYRSNSVDFDSLFAGRTTTAGPNTNYQQAGVDLSQTYEKLSRDQQIPDINYQRTGTDLAALLMGNAAQYTLTSRLTSTKTIAWNNEVNHYFSVIFSSVAARTNFFLYGGRIKMSASRSGGTANTKNTDWTNMCNNMGSVEIGKTNTYRNDSLPNVSPYHIGSDNLTTGWQTIYSASGAGVYSANNLLIQAYAPTSTTVRINVRFRDLATGNPSIDENTDGTLQSFIHERRHNSQAVPTYTVHSNL